MARQSMVDRNAPIGAGICQEKTANVFPTIPKYIQRYVMTPLNTDVKMNGKKKIGFSISGVPKISGSEIPNMEGKKPTFPTVLSCLDLDRIIKKASARTEPEPPMITKYVQNGVVKIFVKS